MIISSVDHLNRGNLFDVVALGKLLKKLPVAAGRPSTKEHLEKNSFFSELVNIGLRI
jgi:hypothetical protein